ncbi:MAG: TetR/AcrR family transcriptional regulator [Kiritimatiellae bacterium]|nr:TetR/AcrR family transcriptional regulator [Kiritimatiellia bacterium]
MARKVDHDERRREIAEKAMRLFSQVGYENVSLIMIAASAGVSRTVLYRYFCSKREVMDAAISTVTTAIERECSVLVATREPAVVRLEKVCHAVVETMFRNREFVIAVFDYVLGLVRTGADMTGGIAARTSGTRSLIRMLLEHAKRRGELPKDIIVDRISDAIYAEFESCAMRIVLATEKDARAAKVRFSDVIRAISIWK